MDQTNKDTNAPASNDQTEDVPAGQQQEVNIDVNQASPVNDDALNQQADDIALSGADPATSTQDVDPLLTAPPASDTQPGATFSGADGSQANTPDQQLPPATPDPGQSSFPSDTSAQPGTDAGLPVNPNLGDSTASQPAAPDLSQPDPLASAPQSAVPAHADGKMAIILGAVGVVVLAAIAFFVFM